MTRGVLGVIICPMVDDNLVYSLGKDPEEKNILLVRDGNETSLVAKFSRYGIQYRMVEWEDVLSGAEPLDRDRFTILIYATALGLHSRPEELKSVVEGLARDMQPLVDGIGFYLGTCGNYDWNIPKWCRENGMKPSAMFVDECGNLCHDCVGVNIAGGPKYKEMQKAYCAHLYVFPAMATNFDEFMEADQAEAAATQASLTDEMREALGIEPGKDGYLRWLLSLGGYEHILRIDTGIGDQEEYEKCLLEVAERTHLKIRSPSEEWASMQPTDDLYAECKSFLSQRAASVDLPLLEVERAVLHLRRDDGAVLVEPLQHRFQEVQVLPVHGLVPELVRAELLHDGAGADHRVLPDRCEQLFLGNRCDHGLWTPSGGHKDNPGYLGRLSSSQFLLAICLSPFCHRRGMRMVFFVSGLTCQECGEKLESHIQRQPGVNAAALLVTGKLIIECEDAYAEAIEADVMASAPKAQGDVRVKRVQ